MNFFDILHLLDAVLSLVLLKQFREFEYLLVLGLHDVSPIFFVVLDILDFPFESFGDLVRAEGVDLYEIYLIVEFLHNFIELEVLILLVLILLPEIDDFAFVSFEIILQLLVLLLGAFVLVFDLNDGSFEDTSASVSLSVFDLELVFVDHLGFQDAYFLNNEQDFGFLIFELILQAGILFLKFFLGHFLDSEGRFGTLKLVRNEIALFTVFLLFIF